MPTNSLYYGDNLEVLRQHIPDESVDLIYLDPPFNSNATYNVLFKTHDGDESPAQIEAFDDTWRWGPQAEDEYAQLTGGGAPLPIARFLEAMRTVLGKSDMLAYLVMMAPRLVELWRVLKTTGSIYLHCDPAASHYLKMLMDSIFGPGLFQNEIAWCYEIGGRSKKRWGRKHDIILFYSKSDQFAFNWKDVAEARKSGTHMRASVDADGREYQEKTDAKSGKVYRYYIDEGTITPDFWIGIQQINREAAERLGYPTQKPLALLERIIKASSNPGDVVLDPFCGCGTAVDAAQNLGRQWIGIDVTYIAVDLIVKRLRHRFGDGITDTFSTNGIPLDIEGAAALFTRNPFDFERWAVSVINGQPNEKQVGDHGIDGRIRFHRGGDVAGLAAVSVKGGRQLNPSMVQALVGALQQERADMGVLVTMGKPTPGMLATASTAGIYEHPPTGNHYPRVQIITVPELFAGKRPNMPTIILPYAKARPRPQSEAVSLFDDVLEVIEELDDSEDE